MSHYKFYDGANEIVPFDAKYAYPNQATRSWKRIVKLPVNISGDMAPGTNFFINFPAEGYLDTGNSFLMYDIEISEPTGTTTSTDVRLSNGAQCVFQRMGIRYGGNVLEDIVDYNLVVRKLNDATGTNQNGSYDQTSINQGLGGLALGTDGTWVNHRLHNIQGWKITAKKGYSIGTQGSTAAVKRRYMDQLALGLCLTSKMIPLKWMAAQYQIFGTLEQANKVLSGLKMDGKVTYKITNMHYVAQLMEFDGAFDDGFRNAMVKNGLPIKFSSWNTYQANADSNNKTINISDRSRSIKAAFCVQTPINNTNDPNLDAPVDHFAMLQSTSGWTDANGKAADGKFLKEFWWRVGGKYYPSQPVICWDGENNSNGASEAYSEFEKALNIVGDYRLSTSISPQRWCPFNATSQVVNEAFDWDDKSTGYKKGPAFFVIASDFESSNGTEISGMNGEEQQDIQLMVKYSHAQEGTYTIFVYYDAMIILSEGNAVNLIK
jgi:hypothetical protein